MGTEILRPQNCLIERIRVPQPAIFYRRRSYYGNANPSYHPNPRSTRKPVVRSEKVEQKKRFVANQVAAEPSVSKRSNSVDDMRVAKSGPAMEKVTILRRGESLDSKFKSEAVKKEEGDEGLVVMRTERLGPAPEMIPKQIRIVDPRSPSPPTMMRKCDVYAGSAFANSPEPSSLPLPSFSKKKQVMSAIVDDSATRDLRRLLRLDL